MLWVFFTFLLPGTFGAMAGLPAPAPLLYTGFIACNILLFGFVGLWLASRPKIDRPVLIIFGISKLTFCALMLMSWRIGEIRFVGFAMSLVDLTMGIIFLLGARQAQDNGQS